MWRRPLLITPEYRELNQQLHENPDYGVASLMYVDQVLALIQSLKVEALLDYGAGKGRLGQALEGKLKVFNYDPAVEKYAAEPSPAEFVVSIDVLEHIEPDCLDAVLDHMARLTERAIFLTVATVPAHKELADGRNAHLIVETPEWWLPKLWQRWELQFYNKLDTGFVYLGTPRVRSNQAAA